MTPKEFADNAAIAASATKATIAAIEAHLNDPTNGIKTISAALTGLAASQPKRRAKYTQALSVVTVLEKTVLRALATATKETKEAEDSAQRVHVESAKTSPKPNPKTMQKDLDATTASLKVAEAALKDACDARTAAIAVFDGVKPAEWRDGQRTQWLVDRPWIPIAAIVLLLIFVGWLSYRVSPDGQHNSEIGSLKEQVVLLTNEKKDLAEKMAGMVGKDQHALVEKQMTDATKAQVAAEAELNKLKAATAGGMISKVEADEALAKLVADNEQLQLRLFNLEKAAASAPAPASTKPPQMAASGSQPQPATPPSTGAGVPQSDMPSIVPTNQILAGIGAGTIGYSPSLRNFKDMRSGVKYWPAQVAALAKREGLTLPQTTRSGIPIDWTSGPAAGKR
ncbi:MAG: hypothetical protein RL094_58 [Candidatus Parcubacteria bacterium]|jgi:hypothetical protein